MKKRASTKSVQRKNGNAKIPSRSAEYLSRHEEKSILNLWDNAGVYPLQSVTVLRAKASPSVDIAAHTPPVDETPQENDTVTYVIREMPAPTHALNHRTLCRKICQDIFLKAEMLQAREVIYIPAWEKYPAYIEDKIATEAAANSKSPLDMFRFRKQCYTLYIKQLEANQEKLKQLGCFAAWELALKNHDARQESKLIPLLSRLREYHYLQDLPHLGAWCPKCSAPLETGKTEHRVTDTLPAFVKFPFSTGFEEFGIDVFFCLEFAHIWEIAGTTELGISENATYYLTRFESEYLLFAEPQLQIFQNHLAKTGQTLEVLRQLRSSELTKCTVSHPLFTSKILKIIPIPENVVEEAARMLKENRYGGDAHQNERFAGVIHLNAAHNPLSYYIAQLLKRSSTSVFDETGKFTEEGDTLCGLNLYDAEKFIVPELEQFGYLLKFRPGTNNESSAPEGPRLHCQRCQTLAVFRPCSKWVFSLSENQPTAELINAPEYWENYCPTHPEALVDVQKTTANFTDLQVSAQQQWGMPLPILFCDGCDEPLTNKNILLAIRNSIRRGPEYWFRLSVEELLPTDTFCPKCNSKEFRKEATLIDTHFGNLLQVIHNSDFKKPLGGPVSVIFGPQAGLSKWLSEVSVISAALSRSRPIKESQPFKQLILQALPILDGKKERSFEIQDAFIAQYPADVCRLLAIAPNVTRRQLGTLAKKYWSKYERLQQLLEQVSTLCQDTDKAGETSEFEAPNVPDEIGQNQRDELALDATKARLKEVEAAYRNRNFHKMWELLFDFCDIDLRFYLQFVPMGSHETSYAARRTLSIIGTLLLQRFAPLTPFLAERFYKQLSESLTKNGALEDAAELIVVPAAASLPDSIFQTNWGCLATAAENAKAEWESLKASSTEAQH